MLAEVLEALAAGALPGGFESCVAVAVAAAELSKLCGGGLLAGVAGFGWEGDKGFDDVDTEGAFAAG